jgi:hypothetical protein
MTMTTTSEKLLRLAEEHEEKAKALRIAAAELNGHQATRAHETLPAKLEQAITLREKQQPRPRPRRAGQSERQKWLIAAFADGQPHTTADLTQTLGLTIPNDRKTLVRDLEAIGATSTSTIAKGRSGRRLLWQLKPIQGTGVLVPAKRRPAKAPKETTGQRTGTRQRTAKILDQLARAAHPVSTADFPNPRVISVLLNTGYIAKRDNGYVRTDKPFTI